VRDEKAAFISISSFETFSAKKKSLTGEPNWDYLACVQGVPVFSLPATDNFTE